MLFQLTSWLCHLPALGSQASDRAFLRLSLWVKWVSGRTRSLQPSSGLSKHSVDVSCPGVAHVYLVISGGGALRSWLWHLGPQHPEILT